jgi:hypothetical protein
MSEPVDPIEESLDELREAQRVLSVAQVSLWLRIPKEEVVRLAESGQLPARPLNGEWRFGALAINRWLAGDRVGGELAALQASLTEMAGRINELVARLDSVLDILPQLPHGKMLSEGATVTFDIPEAITLDALETAYIRHVMQACQNNKAQAASVLGIDASTLYRKLARLGW